MTGLISLMSKALKSLLQKHSPKASIPQPSAFFMVQLSHPYMTTGKTIALTRRTFVDKVMSLLFNMLSRLVIAFLPRSKYLHKSRNNHLINAQSIIHSPQLSRFCHTSNLVSLLKYFKVNVRHYSCIFQYSCLQKRFFIKFNIPSWLKKK